MILWWLVDTTSCSEALHSALCGQSSVTESHLALKPQDNTPPDDRTINTRQTCCESESETASNSVDDKWRFHSWPKLLPKMARARACLRLSLVEFAYVSVHALKMA